AFGQHEVRRGKTGKARDRALEFGRGGAPVPQSDQRLPVVVVRLEAVDPARCQRAKARGGAFEVAVAQFGETLVQQRVEDLVVVDLVFRIGSGRGSVRRAAARIPERAQLLDELDGNAAA